MAIIGNPPYRRLAVGENETLVGRWMDHLWEDLKKPVKDAKQGNQLNTFPELSVAFWRWAMWKLFESDHAPKRGVVAFITNRKFLTGWPYAGSRKMMRERFDRIEIIDLRGDVRLGERADVEGDEGVFNIKVGTAITVATADGSKPVGALADVTYNDTWEHGLLQRRTKLDWLDSGAELGALPGAITVSRGPLADMRPRPFFNGQLVSIRDIFSFSKSGMKSGDDSTFVSLEKSQLKPRIVQLIENRADPTYLDQLEIYYSYRPLDRRYFFNDPKLLNRPGPELQSVWGQENVALYAVPTGTNSGPAVWCHGLLPDYHAFRGNYGGYAFPLFDRRAAHGPYNLRSEVVSALTAAYGSPSMPVSPESVFDTVLALLSASTYSRRFAEDLENTFPHVPFPSDRTNFDRAAEIGAEIRAVETFSRQPGSVFTKGRSLISTEPKGLLAAGEYKDGGIALCADGTGRVDNIPVEIWEFSVSGYRVLLRWLDARKGSPVDEAFTRALRDLVGRIGELIDLFARADDILGRTLANPLSREALGFDAIASADGDDGGPR